MAHLSYVRDKTGHALIGARQWIPASTSRTPVKSQLTGLPLNLRSGTKGQLAIDISKDVAADGIRLGLHPGPRCTATAPSRREHFEAQGQARALRGAVEFASSPSRPARG